MSALIDVIQHGKKFPLKLIPQDIDRDKKVLFGSPEFFVRGKTAARNDAVHVDMIKDLLIPCVEYLYDPGSRTKILRIKGQFQKRFGTASVEQAIKELLVAVKKGI